MQDEEGNTGILDQRVPTSGQPLNEADRDRSQSGKAEVK